MDSFSIESIGKLVLHALYNSCGAIGRVVFNDQNVKAVLQGKDGPDNLLDVLALVVSGNDYYTVVYFMHVSLLVYS